MVPVIHERPTVTQACQGVGIIKTIENQSVQFSSQQFEPH